MAGNVMTLAEAPVRAWTKALAGLGRGPRAYLRGLTRARTGQVVQQGPLAGMHYIDGAIESAYIPKLLGIYERELWPVVASLDATEFRTLVNVGAGEGYYAVGLARRHSDIRVVAFEALEAGRAAIVRMAHLNRVADRIAVRGCCDLLAALQAALHEDSHGDSDLRRRGGRARFAASGRGAGAPARSGARGATRLSAAGHQRGDAPAVRGQPPPHGCSSSRSAGRPTSPM